MPAAIFETFVKNENFRLLVSQALATEVERTFARKKFRQQFESPFRLDAWLAAIRLDTELVPDTGRIQGVCKDPKDDFILSAAVEGKADYIVTGDADLLKLDPFEGVRIVTPRAFLDVLENRRS
ncbi:putative toxin-antitoxin system toxin component, PIN family [bacterium]|nr:putative toxin-antitoxin system toxin component, PIN family [bacterium]